MTAAGLRQQRRNRVTGHLVGLYDGIAADMDTEAGRWQTVCEEHGSIISHDTLALAESNMSQPIEWCEDCRAEAEATLAPVLRDRWHVEHLSGGKLLRWSGRKTEAEFHASNLAADPAVTTRITVRPCDGEGCSCGLFDRQTTPCLTYRGGRLVMGLR